MKRKGFRPKKHLGQNFLYDPAIAGKIVAAAGLEPGETVVELGSGKGILTRPLAAAGAHLVTIELDKPLYEGLAAEFAAAPSVGEGSVEILNADLSEVALSDLLATRGFDSCVLFGNIPYTLTREVLFSFLVDEHELIRSAYLMVQREVGRSIHDGTETVSRSQWTMFVRLLQNRCACPKHKDTHTRSGDPTGSLSGTLL